EHNEMVKIVKSEEVKTLIEKRLKDYDEKSLTDRGIIKAYDIDEKSIRRNPMGGIDFTIYLNNNKNYYAHYRVEKSQNENYNLGGGSKSINFKKLLGEKSDE
uniref:DUF1310 family protein n=1 Tax=Streptococcus constellatus TaxID=76860 RepID=UPI0006609453